MVSLSSLDSLFSSITNYGIRLNKVRRSEQGMSPLGRHLNSANMKM